MSTLSELEQAGFLENIDGDLDTNQMPQRYLYALPRALKWLKEVLPTLQTDGYVAGALDPSRQAYNLFHTFTSGMAITNMPPHSMKPEQKGVWELRTHDLRFFGWFWRRSQFIIADASTKKQCNNHCLYNGYLNIVIYERERLNLDEPKFITGAIEHVF